MAKKAKKNAKCATPSPAMDAAPLAFLERLLDSRSPSGAETAVIDVVENYIRPVADRVQRDTLGSLSATINPGRTPRVILVGHADEIGLMVHYIESDGFLRARALGGVDVATIAGYPVDILTQIGRAHV